MVWDKTLPIEFALAPTYNNIMRADKTALEAALNAYFYFVTGGTQTGQPRQGSARPYYQATAPATRLDGDYFDSTDYGTLWCDSDDAKWYYLSSADGAGTDVWTLLSTEIIALIVSQANAWAGIQTFSVAPVFTIGIAANDTYIVARNNAGDGNINMWKINTSDGITAGAIVTLYDGSLLASSAAPTTDAMIANKKFVDDMTKGAAPTANDSDATAMLKAHAYLAQTSGFVNAFHTANSSGQLNGYVGATTDPAGAGTLVDNQIINAGGSAYPHVHFFVPNGMYFEITTAAAAALSIVWTPMKSGGAAPIDQD